jgi:hypothetical protein
LPDVRTYSRAQHLLVNGCAVLSPEVKLPEREPDISNAKANYDAPFLCMLSRHAQDKCMFTVHRPEEKSLRRGGRCGAVRGSVDSRAAVNASTRSSSAFATDLAQAHLLHFWQRPSPRRRTALRAGGDSAHLTYPVSEHLEFNNIRLSDSVTSGTADLRVRENCGCPSQPIWTWQWQWQLGNLCVASNHSQPLTDRSESLTD